MKDMMFDCFRDPQLARTLIRAVREKAERLGRKARLMEVCGTHTVAYSRSGLRDLLAEAVELRSGPGCPVCVTSREGVDAALALARDPSITLCTYGDMMRVPGSRSSLLKEKSRGADVRVVYSAFDAVNWAESAPDRRVIFLAVGFETTAPGLALALKRVRDSAITNFLVFSLQKVVPPALRALLDDSGAALDGLICPGHVATVIGRRSFDFLARDYGVPAVIAGFEPLDLLYALDHLLAMLVDGRVEVINAYTRAVREEGNPLAREAMREHFREIDDEWRGLGIIPDSGLGLREGLARFDADPLVPDDLPEPEEQPACSCSEILRGRSLPHECALFGSGCTPESPIGPCMVSSEGACAAYYLYHGPDLKRSDGREPTIGEN